jgi:hypothetical protein
MDYKIQFPICKAAVCRAALARMRHVALGLLLALLISTPVLQGAEPTKAALLVIDQDVAANRELTAALANYRKQVQNTFGYRLIQVVADAAIAPEDMRALLRQRVQEQQIAGAFLVGRFRLATFRGGCGDLAAFPEFFQDLDGDIRDEDADGIYDFYDPWPVSATAPACELWLAVLRPYRVGPRGRSGLNDLTTYFTRITAAMQAPARTSAATIFASYDWPNQDGLQRELQASVRSPVRLFGGNDPLSKQARRTTVSEFREALARHSNLLCSFIHSSVSVHTLDGPDYPGNLVVPWEMDYPGRALLDDMPVNARVMTFWSCHLLDIEHVTYLNGRFLANSYLLRPRSRAEAILAPARSIGLEHQEKLIRALRTAPLCEAWLSYQNHLYSSPFLRQFLDRVWQQEGHRFAWHAMIYGNPFVHVFDTSAQGSHLTAR